MGWGCVKHEWDAGSARWGEFQPLVADACNPEGSRAHSPCPLCVYELLKLAYAAEAMMESGNKEKQRHDLYQQVKVLRDLGVVAPGKEQIEMPRIVALLEQKERDDRYPPDASPMEKLTEEWGEPKPLVQCECRNYACDATALAVMWRGHHHPNCPNARSGHA